MTSKSPQTNDAIKDIKLIPSKTISVDGIKMIYSVRSSTTKKW